MPLVFKSFQGDAELATVNTHPRHSHGSFPTHLSWGTRDWWQCGHPVPDLNVGADRTLLENQTLVLFAKYFNLIKKSQL